MNNFELNHLEPECAASQKRKMKKRLWEISTLCTFKLIHWVILAGLFITFFPYALHNADPQVIYALILIFSYPVILSIMLKNMKHNLNQEEILPAFSSHYKYSINSHLAWSWSFILEIFTLLLFQYGNTLAPYRSIRLQYGPSFVAAFALFLRICAPFMFRYKFHRALLYNTWI